MKKKRLIIFTIITLASIIVVLLSNYIFLCPKPSKKATIIKFNPSNIIGLNSIIVDGNQKIYKINYFFNIISLKEINHKYEDITPLWGTDYYSRNYDITVKYSLFSKYVIVSSPDIEKISGIIFQKYKSYSTIEGLTCVELFHVKLDFENHEKRVIYQSYDDTKKTWGKRNKWREWIDNTY